ncbi:MAG: hypothetical protein H6R26_719, partial [Proteobacteria bacterium]|nr:hypothetical protein [Pseudomonadota bacterium]
MQTNSSLGEYLTKFIGLIHGTFSQIDGKYSPFIQEIFTLYTRKISRTSVRNAGYVTTVLGRKLIVNPGDQQLCIPSNYPSLWRFVRCFNGVAAMMFIPQIKTPSYIESRLHLKKFASLRKKVEHATTPRAYAWIEFPAWAADMPRLVEPVTAVCKSAKECEHYSGTIRVSDIVQNGRFSDLEQLFQEVSVPYDCGGDEPRCRSLWNGWWRKG